MSDAPKPHSADVLNDLRDLWWNLDHADLLARRMRLDEVTSLCDVGCGIGHWGRMWLARLAPGARIVGVDREPRWVARVPYPAVVGDAVALPFADASFDAATCQTLLMHLTDPAAAVRELARIVKPGGLVFCSEPNNFYNMIRFDEVTSSRSVEDFVAIVDFEMRLIRGKIALAKGDSLIGDQVPRLLVEAGLQPAGAWQSDRATPMVPPYDDVARTILDAMAENRKLGKSAWDEPVFREYYLAGGGDEASFVRTWALLHERAADEEQRVAAGTYATGGTGVLLLAAARKPR